MVQSPLPAQAVSPGIYQGPLLDRRRLLEAAAASSLVGATVGAGAVVAKAAPDILQETGTVTMLRVHEVVTGFGPPSDAIDVEVVFWLNRAVGEPGLSFGFQLRNDGNGLAHQGMLDVLRDAFNNNWTVTTDYEITPGKTNGLAIRVWLTK